MKKEGGEISMGDSQVVKRDVYHKAISMRECMKYLYYIVCLFSSVVFRALGCGHVYGVYPITTVKVPILKVVDCGTRIECNISFENKNGVPKSKIIHMICSLNEWFQKLSFLLLYDLLFLQVKAWAKAHNINSSRDKTLNSLSVILLVAYHLQLGIISWLVNILDGFDPDVVAKLLHKFVNYGNKNKEPVAAELLVTFYCRLRGYGPKDYVQVSTKNRGYLSNGTPKFVASVEDFTNQSQNSTRDVGKAEVKRTYKCIQRTREYIYGFIDGLVKIPTLKYQLFGRATPFQDSSETRNNIEEGNTTTLPCGDIKKRDQSKESQKGSQSAIPFEHIATKRKLSTKGWEGLTSVNLPGQKGNGLPMIAEKHLQ
ncbi:hypothetical protein H5410_046692 [Solanum commersonii]|uniref:Poly(A) RNA polymerase mitochondrial-like central palm domain-containing protein n=1 Tax=Solanum commersonii TaxID=4109 RepID=A0A9J5XF09_SOLCO|nr:hypothetical protein H5410_046692 [Solanum commersonii]